MKLICHGKRMNNARFLKTAIFVFVGILLSVPPLIEILRLLCKLDLANFHDIFTQSKQTRILLKSFITYGMSLFLSFFTLLYTYSAYLTEPRVRKGCWAILAIMVIGSVGFIIQPDHKITYHLVNHSLDDMHLNNAELTINFGQIPTDLLDDTHLALSNQVDIFITPKFANSPHFTDVPIAFNGKTIMSNMDYKLTEDDIKSFIKDKTFTFHVNSSQAHLVIRDIKGSPLIERQDVCRINGKILNLPFDRGLWFYIKIQDKLGKPLKVYY